MSFYKSLRDKKDKENFVKYILIMHQSISSFNPLVDQLFLVPSFVVSLDEFEVVLCLIFTEYIDESLEDLSLLLILLSGI